MTTFDALAQQYIDTWNETDAARRAALIARTYTEDATYIDPLMAGEGHTGIDAMIGSVRTQFPAFRFALSSTVDAHNDRLRFSWDLGPEGTDAVIKGTDFAVVEDGRLKSVTGFIDQMPTQG